MTRRQLEYEARQIRAAMEEQLGTCQDMEERAQVGWDAETERLETGTAKFRVWNHDFSDEVFLICPQGRVARIQQIEKDMLRIRTRLQAQSADVEVLDYSAVYNKVVFRERDWTLDSRLEAISTKFYKLKEYFTQKWKFDENVLTLRQSKR